MTIILYSDLKPGVSEIVDNQLLTLLHGSSCRVAYIPSESDPKRRYFQKTQQSYEKLGIDDLTYFDLGLEFNPHALPNLFRHDAIHLSGGDPAKFLEQIKARQFGTLLKKYWKS